MKFYKQTTGERQEKPAPTADRNCYVEPGSAGTVVWITKPKPVSADETLTIHDRRELAAANLNNVVINTRAKMVYAAGGDTKAIREACRISPDYAKKLHAAFGRALKRKAGAK